MVEEIDMKSASPMKKSRVFRHKFDFELGHLIKSPCRECMMRKRLPKCLDECELLEKIQILLAETVSCTKSDS